MKKYNIGWKCSECNVLSALLCYSTRSDHILSKLGFSRSICPKLLHAAHTDPLTRVNQLDLSQWPAWASKNYKSAKKTVRGLSRAFAGFRGGSNLDCFFFRGSSRDFAGFRGWPEKCQKLCLPLCNSYSGHYFAASSTFWVCDLTVPLFLTENKIFKRSAGWRMTSWWNQLDTPPLGYKI